MKDKETETIAPLFPRMNEPKDNSGFTTKYGQRGVTVVQEPYAEGFLERLNLAKLARIKDEHVPYTWKDNGRVAVDENGDLLVGLTVKNGSGRSQVMVRIESEEVFAHLAEMRAKASKSDG